MNNQVFTSYKQHIESNDQVVQRLMKYSGLEEKLIRNIVKFCKCLRKPGYGSIDCEIFSVVLSTYFNIIDQTALMKVYTRKAHGQPDNQMSMEDFAKILCAFLTNNLDLKIDYVFKIYDIDGDGIIDMAEVNHFVRYCKCATDTDEADKDETFYDLSYMATTLLGIGSEGVTLEKFRAKVKKHSLILSILGEALPNQGFIDRFRQQIADKTNLQMIQTFGDIRYQLLREIPDNSTPSYYPIVLDLP